MITSIAPPTYNDHDLLSRLHETPEPRHLFVLPTWLHTDALDRLIELGYVTCAHCQRNQSGSIRVAMGLKLTAKGRRLINAETDWKKLALKGSMAGASLAAMSTVILYLG